MRCPKDAYKDYKLSKNLNNWCLQKSPNFGWVCTRLKNHRGLHHAHAVPDTKCLEVWSD